MAYYNANGPNEEAVRDAFRLACLNENVGALKILNTLFTLDQPDRMDRRFRAGTFYHMYTSGPQAAYEFTLRWSAWVPGDSVAAHKYFVMLRDEHAKQRPMTEYSC